jgi:hypothetical protein
VRLAAITAAQHRLLAELTGHISSRLAAACEKRIRPESLNVGVTLQERGKNGRLEIPHALLQEAESNLTARDRMLFRPPPARPRTDIAPLSDPARWNRGNLGRGGRARAALSR